MLGFVLHELRQELHTWWCPVINKQCPQWHKTTRQIRVSYIKKHQKHINTWHLHLIHFLFGWQCYQHIVIDADADAERTRCTVCIVHSAHPRPTSMDALKLFSWGVSLVFWLSVLCNSINPCTFDDTSSKEPTCVCWRGGCWAIHNATKRVVPPI